MENNNNRHKKREVRKVQGLVGEQSFSIVLPKSYAVNLGIGKGDYVEVYQEEDRLIVEKVR
jgi:AbrB family looped-hinge helix DNA binding protein